MPKKAHDFYEQVNRETHYTTGDLQNHDALPYIEKFINDFQLTKKKCLEIGSGKGLYQDMVEDYTGMDVAENLRKYYHKPYVTVAVDGYYPLPDNTFDAIWTWNTHEHIESLNLALNELKRVLKPGGVVLFNPAWQCNKWAAEGYEVRPFSDFNIWGKLVKLSIPLRKNFVFKYSLILSKRLLRHLLFLTGKKYRTMPRGKLKPSYDKYWTADSDAINCLDQHAAILWFESNGFRCISHPLPWKPLFCRKVPVFRKV
ncbi:MAG: class I SAM-dependent methyltransferase [Candidatus Margulisbacteria bacterium]|nr:class I SAM-dependent methyltransferase [Candidatus Margulisiibacteriota bacterium]